MPVLVFNLHEQFQALRESGAFERMRDGEQFGKLVIRVSGS